MEYDDVQFGMESLYEKNHTHGRNLVATREWREKLRRQYRPANLMAMPDFMQPKVVAPAQVAVSLAATPSKADDKTLEPTRRLICRQCGAKISFAEGKFCWNNPGRFNGEQYCREHQGGGEMAGLTMSHFP